MAREIQGSDPILDLDKQREVLRSTQFSDVEKAEGDQGYYLPLPESSGTWKVRGDASHSTSRKAFAVAIGGAIVFFLGIVIIATLFSPDQEEKTNIDTFVESSSVPYGLQGNEMPNISISSWSYRPKSKERTVLNHSKTLSFRWSEAKQHMLRTAFHFQPEKNWMNDPNAPLYYKGWYHLFYQYNPRAAVWGLISWGHAVSADLIHWLYLDLAMVPDHWYDCNGVWTGSATSLHDGTPVIMYTGSTNESVQVQNMAFPEDPSDPLLRKWVKFSQNPVLVPPVGIGRTDFRDPTTAWLGADGLWRLALGSKAGRTGIALIYQSPDLKSWEKQDHFLYQVQGTGMWECIDFFPISASGDSMGLDTSASGIGVRHVLKASMDDNKQDYYVIGTYHLNNHTFTPDDPSKDLGYGWRYDYGKYYASKTFYDPVERRRILWGWVNESDSEQADIQKGWASVQAIPRQIWLDNRTKANLIQWPVKELLDLRRTVVSREGMRLEGGSVVKVDGASGAQLDIELTFDNPLSKFNGAVAYGGLENECSQGGAATRGFFGPFGLLILSSYDREEQTAVYFSLSFRNGSWATRVCSDQSRSSLASNLDKTFVYGSFVPVLEDEDTLSLRVIVDHSIVEAYVQGGRTCITSRVYPTKALEDAAHLFVFNNGSVPVRVQSLKAWHMRKVSMHPF